MLRLIRCASLFLFASVFVHADLVILEKVESAALNGEVTVKVKGEQARIDMSNPQLGKTTILKDFKADQTTMLIHAKKVALKMTSAQAKAAIQARQKAAGIDPSNAAPKATGEKEKVGDWDCETYTMELGGGKSGKLWLCKNYPNYESIKEQLGKEQAMSLSDAGFDPEKFKLPGVVVKMTIDLSNGPMTRTLVSAKDEPVADSEFEVPGDYKQITPPAAPPAK